MSAQLPCAVERFLARRRELADDDDEDIATSDDPYGVAFDVEKLSISDVTAWMRACGVNPIALDEHITIGPAPHDDEEEGDGPEEQVSK